MKMITAAECVRKMRQAGVYKGKESYFSQLVTKGVIPSHVKAGSPKKWYLLDEVKQALRDWEDPARYPQREANEKRREEIEKNKTLDIDEMAEALRLIKHRYVLANDLYRCSYADILKKYKIDDAGGEFFSLFVTARAVNEKMAEVTKAIRAVSHKTDFPMIFSPLLVEIEKAVADQLMIFEDFEDLIDEEEELGGGPAICQ